MQKIVIKLSINCDKCRSKALQIAAGVRDVTSAAITGEEKNQLEVVGQVDAVELTRRLRKKMPDAELVSVGEVKKEEAAAAPDKGQVLVVEPPWTLNNSFPHCYFYEVRERVDPTSCSIL